MQPRQRVVFVQISDLHFSKRQRNLRFDGISGYRGHEHQLAMALPLSIDDALEDVGADRSTAALIVSGDLTVSGTGDEFARAHQWLHTLQPRGKINFWGLDWQAKDHRVPGNHDHWDGHMPRPTKPLPLQRAFNPDLFPHAERNRDWPPPFVSHPWCLPLADGSLAVELYGIDSQSGFAADDTNLRARGAISPTQLQDLEALVVGRGANPDTVRILVVHHPLEASTFGLHDLDHESLRALGAILQRHRFVGVIAGHRHVYRPGQVTVRSENGTRVVHERRCPSSLQGPPLSEVQGFLLHEVIVDEQGRRWVTVPWLWDGDVTRFVRSATDHVETTPL